MKISNSWLVYNWMTGGTPDLIEERVANADAANHLVHGSVFTMLESCNFLGNLHAKNHAKPILVTLLKKTHVREVSSCLLIFLLRVTFLG